MCRNGPDGWELWVDWSAADGAPPLPVSVERWGRFAADLPAAPATLARRRRQIAAVACRLGHPPEVPAGRPPSSDIGRVLAAATVGGWPEGVAGRRNAALFAAVAVCGLSRPAVRRLTARPSPGLSGLLRARTDRPGVCPACAITRWARLVVHVETFGTRHVRDELADTDLAVAGAADWHDCDIPVRWPPPASPGPPLFSAVDRHGSLELALPLTVRSVGKIVAEFAASVRPGPDGPPGPSGTARPVRAGDDSERLARLDRLIDDVEARFAHLFDAGEGI